MKKLTVTGCAAWILGLLTFLVGLNLPAGTARGWLITAGSIVFLIGLFFMGIVWFRKKRDE
ncbi:MAG: hypothetical protein MJ142_02785 [Clostridia bacterium]|nr:hypothetical protein [Clostridia bacterium]